MVTDGTAKTHGDFLKEHVALRGTRLFTDGTNKLHNVAKEYERYTVDHHIGEYVRADAHVNNVEQFWSHIKRSIKGTYKSVSKQHFQSYLDAFVFHYNNRHNDRERFSALLGILLRDSR